MERTFDEGAMETVRRAYARQMLALAGVDDPALEAAFAAVRREAFLGPPPWRMMLGHGGYRTLPTADPVPIYQDVNVALAEARGVNNGSPALHAAWLHAMNLGPGARVVHVGAGAGYYTAILAQLVGPDGRVVAVEFDPGLAETARANLAHLPHVRVETGDGGGWPREPVDGVYVNFLVAHPAAAWIEGLRPGGRLIFPLGVPRRKPSPDGGRHTRHGAALLVERGAAGFSARSLGPVRFVCAEGPLLGTEREHESLGACFERGGIEFVRSLRWREPASAARSWYVGPDWSLGYDEAA